jgi:hypothetical protein
MVTIHTKGMQKLTIMVNDFGIIMVLKKWLCAMFNFQFVSVHVSKDDAYDELNHVTKSTYQPPIASSQGL